VLKNLLDLGESVVAYDLSADTRRAAMIVEAETLSRVVQVTGDVCDVDGLVGAIDAHAITHVIHLAALQVPFCKADPIKGARVNVLGTLAVLEAIRRSEGRIPRLSYASSAAVYGSEAEEGGGMVTEADDPHPGTHYGVFKRANEGNARVYWNDEGIPSVGFRPLTVFGPGRDQGITSSPTVACKAAVVGKKYHIPFGGKTAMVYVDDVAKLFIAAADAGLDGARVYNVCGEIVSMADIVGAIHEASGTRDLIGFDAEKSIPITPLIDEGKLRQDFKEIGMTRFSDGMRSTVATFQSLHEQGRLDTREIQS
jgi:nucleoside-diphosphate-sugar epimerase